METINRRSAQHITRSGLFPLRCAVLNLPYGPLAVFSPSEGLKRVLVETAGLRDVEILGDGTFGLTRAGKVLLPDPTPLTALVNLVEGDHCALGRVGGQRRLSMLLAAGSTGELEPVAGDPWYDSLLDITASLPVWEMVLPPERRDMRAAWPEIAMLLAESAS